MALESVSKLGLQSVFIRVSSCDARGSAFTFQKRTIHEITRTNTNEASALVCMPGCLEERTGSVEAAEQASTSPALLNHEYGKLLLLLLAQASYIKACPKNHRE